jgi:hypothetical protein
MNRLAAFARQPRFAAGALALLVAGVAAAALVAAGPGAASERGGVPKPVLESARGEKCVADTDFMRRNHMKLLIHQRDETVHDGIRGNPYSLKQCVECHASRKNGSVIGSNENFCQGCHSYASVKLDCFECHASKPAATALGTGTPGLAR